MSLPDFHRFPKIPRFHSPCTITEKLDGTNAVIRVQDITSYVEHYGGPETISGDCAETYLNGNAWNSLLAGSRKKWLAPGEDNHGFRAWVEQNAEHLTTLDPGTYHGEWWGKKINRGYGLDEKRFTPFGLASGKPVEHDLFHPLPVLYEGRFFPEAAYECLLELQNEGSRAAPGFKPAEGIVIRFNDTGARLKLTLKALEEFSYSEHDGSNGSWYVSPKEFPQKGPKS